MFGLGSNWLNFRNFGFLVGLAQKSDWVKFEKKNPRPPFPILIVDLWLFDGSLGYKRLDAAVCRHFCTTIRLYQAGWLYGFHWQMRLGLAGLRFGDSKS